MVFTLDSLSVVLEQEIDFEAKMKTENAHVLIPSLCLGVIECLRFEKTKDGIRLIVSGSSHNFGIESKKIL